ncbi:DUF3040 domain-containing protein [Corynebacterium lubricantis]|uniref:DUF3040 domain-containing protein n=1 Tax=Corynebacterium lubricantis TaxID=541095 RepID=UPI0003747C6A|nr:DUF3040 domain-containing protein [Corynebacterium lubricantis]
MALSEQEQRALREIEQSLLAEDPKFGASVSAQSSFGGGAPSGKTMFRGIALAVLGLVLLIAGVALAQVSLWFIALSVLGFIVMFGAGVWVLRSPQGGSRGSSSSSRKKSAPADGQGGGVGSRMEDNFRRRFEDNEG